MNIALHDAEADHFKTFDKFPNFALMKLSAWHKAQGDNVEWWIPVMTPFYDKIYSSKVFEWTPVNEMLPDTAIKGGTGYGLFNNLPDEIDAMFPDYSIYPSCDYAIGFITRGCINKCRWCGVPKKEGYLKPYSKWQDIVRTDTNKLTLMDNNILASTYGVSQLEELSHTDYRIDINQGMDARLVTDDIADILSKIKWQHYMRFSVDSQAQINAVIQTAEKLMSRGMKGSKIFLYCLITQDIEESLSRVYAMRDIPNVSLYGMPERNPSQNIMPNKDMLDIAQRYIYSGQWRKMSYDEWKEHYYGE